MYSVIAGTANQATIPSSSALESLKLLQWFRSQNFDDNDDIGQLFREETKYLNSAINMINNDPIIASKFGTDLQSAMNLSGLLKEVYSENQAKQHLLEYINKEKIDVSNAQKELGKFRKGTAISSRSSE